MELKELKEHYKKEIENIAKEAYNNEQKSIANYIIDNANKDNIDSIYTFITQRVKLGFTFDAAPEVSHNAISLCKKNDKMSFENVGGIEHKLIIGENYDALKNLLVTYTNQIDIIYIDPPYNTEKTKEDGNDYKDEVKADKFIYRDKFTRNGWLNMMRERLTLARKLLSKNGAIFISIDDNMQAYLKVLCDEVFGENNFVGNIIWSKKTGAKGVPPKSLLANTNEYIIVYQRQDYFKFLGIERNIKDFKNPDNDPRGPWRESNIKSTTKSSEEAFTIVNPTTGKKYTNTWAFSKESLEKMILEGRIIWKENLPKQKEYLHEMTNENKALTTTWGVYDAQKTTVFLKDLIPNEKFDNPKPLSLIKYLLKVSSRKNNIILDFFAGSGTTAQAVMELNAEDNGNRKCILVTNNENNIAKDITYERLYRVIKGKGTNGETFNWTYTKKEPYLTNNSLSVFDLEQYELKIDDYEKAKDLVKKANIVFKQLNEDYEAKDFDIYNQLSSLRPYKKEEK